MLLTFGKNGAAFHLYDLPGENTQEIYCALCRSVNSSTLKKVRRSAWFLQIPDWNVEQFRRVGEPIRKLHQKVLRRNTLWLELGDARLGMS